ncbi:MAG: GAF domain-containing protein [Cytophagales bacterium]
MEINNITYYQKADKTVEISYWCFVIFSLVLSPVYDTWLISFAVNSLLMISYYSSKLLLPNSRFYQFLGSFNFAIFTALLIYQMHGMLEMHFIAFIGSILLMHYKDWKLQIPLTLGIVVHHSTFAYIQYLGFKEIYFTTENYMDLQRFIVHVFLAAVIFFLCGLWSYLIYEQDLTIAKSNNTLKEQINQISKSINLAKNIASGNFNHQENIQADDELGQSLLAMQMSLKLAKEKEDKDKFLNVGISKLVEILRQQQLNTQQICDASLSFLIKYTQSNQGVIYLINNELSETCLRLVSCYAYDRKKYINSKLSPGEGLLGQVFLEEETTLITEVPENYIRITSGLGDATPRTLLIVPLKYNDKCFGVLEIASFKKIEHYMIEFLEKAAENLASVISNLKNTENNSQILSNLQIQTEEMKAQEEEMRQNMEELLATQEEMNRRQKEFLEREKIYQEKIKQLEILNIVNESS